MLFVLICTYLGAWGCAHAAVSAWPGRPGFWVFYAIAVGLVPLLSGWSLRAVFGLANPDYAATITPVSVLIGVALALVAYPIKYLRSKHEK